MSDNSNQDSANKVSPEQAIQLRDQHMKILEEQLPYLRIRAEFQKLKADIASDTLREKMAKMQTAKLEMPPEPSEKEEQE
jgi:hypothetical protein